MPLQNNLRRIAIFTAALLFIQYACKKTDGYNIVVSDDPTKPGVVTNIKVVNFNGGAYITYTLPSTKNTLYVQAEYRINDKRTRQTKSSYYSDSITVSGFAKSQDYEVILTTVSRANVKSDSVKVIVHPSTPPHLLVVPTINLRSDFGGVNVTINNKTKSNIGVILIGPDSINTYRILTQKYTNADSLSFSLRGYDTVARKFGVYITDEWDNISDTIFKTITPIFETQMERSGFKQYTLPTDASTDFGWVLPNLWDGNLTSPGYHTPQPISPLVWPAVITFDMGKAAKLSRFTIWDRGIDGSGNFLWDYGAPKTWVLWGRTDNPQDETMPDTMHLPAVGQATAKGWINLGIYNAPAKPSGLPNPQYTNADLAFWNEGFSYNFSLSVPKVRYLRFQCISNMGETNNFFNIEELSFWGDPR